jgi:hypothetical protein
MVLDVAITRRGGPGSGAIVDDLMLGRSGVAGGETSGLLHVLNEGIRRGRMVNREHCRPRIRPASAQAGQ